MTDERSQESPSPQGSESAPPTIRAGAFIPSARAAAEPAENQHGAQLGAGPVDDQPGGDRQRGRSRVRRMMVVVGIVAVLMAVTGAVVAVRGLLAEPAVPKAAASSALDWWDRPKPEDHAWKLARSQVEALLRGDEQGWLAVVDPAQPQYVERYRTLFRNLRAMKVSAAQALVARPQDAYDANMYFIGFVYCFTGSPCPDALHQPSVVKRVTLKPDGADFRITVVDWDPKTIYNQSSAPWFDDQLVVAEGKRVVVGASASKAMHLSRFVALADQAVNDLDRFAPYLRTQQDRYRLFLADSRDWKTWFKGKHADWAMGFASELAGTGMDVVLNVDRVLKSDAGPLDTVRHEFGHVLTTSGAKAPDNSLKYLFSDPEQWLREGIAEYIGQNGRPPQTTYRAHALRAAFRGPRPPKSITASSVYEGSERGDVSSLYAMGYFASSCMAAKYGEARLFRFSDIVLRDAKTFEQGSRAAFGKSFKEVNRTCLAWIRQRL